MEHANRRDKLPLPVGSCLEFAFSRNAFGFDYAQHADKVIFRTCCLLTFPFGHFGTAVKSDDPHEQ
jgi:hypothetical protein